MKITVNGQTYIVRIRYEMMPGWVFLCGRRTFVSLHDKNDLRVGIGIATCSLGDKFCKATGRKIAFGRALLDHGFSKDERREAWGQFLALTRD